jgi:serine/threonine-protein kinase
MIRLGVLGSVELRGSQGEEILSILSQPKRTAILVYLAVAAPRGFHRRDKIAGLFWPEVDQDRARASLRKAIHFLRRSLGGEVVPNRGDEEVGLDWNRFACDAVDFQAALDADDVSAAMDLYRGDLLEGFFLDGCPEFELWMEEERRAFRDRAARAAWELAHRHLTSGQLAGAERAGHRAVSLLGTQEEEVRRLVEALADAGNRAAAVRLYERFCRVLLATLDLEPSPETEALVRRIKSPAAPAGARPASKPPPLEPEGRASEFSSRAAPVQELSSFIRRELASDFEILRALGGGGDEVALCIARERALERLVLIKVLTRELSGDPVARLRFEREAKAAASLEHPNAVSVHRFGWLEDEIPFLVMQYVDGPTLEEKLAAEGPLPVPAARKILAQVAAALGAAHQRGFVHRDVCSANVLWDRKTDRALLSNFGLAGVLPKKVGSLPRVTRTGEVLGRAGFSSPEQVRGEEATEGTDVYTLGLLAYEVLTGEGPFPATTVPEAAAAHLGWAPRPLTSLVKGIDPGFADLIGRCLFKEPGRRPSAEYLSKALGPDEEAAAGPPLVTEGHPFLARARRRLGRAVSLAIVIGLGLLLIVGLLSRSGFLPDAVFPVASSTVLCGVVAIGVRAWFREEERTRRTTSLELTILGVVALVWVAAGFAMLS